VKHRILALIKAHPGINDAEISDKLEIEQDLVFKILRSALEDGYLTSSAITPPNGRPIRAYRHTGKEERREAPVTMKNLPLADQPASIAPTKPDLAIQYLEKHGTATNKELAAAIGLKKGYTPFQFLKSSITAGRLKYADGIWKLGPAKSPKPAIPQEQPMKPECPAHIAPEMPESFKQAQPPPPGDTSPSRNDLIEMAIDFLQAAWECLEKLGRLK